MAGVVLRPATAGDAPVLTEIFLAARGAMDYLPVLHTDEETAAFVAALVQSSQVQLAERRGRIVGFAAVRGTWLEHLYVHPEAQSTGVGAALVGWVKDVAATAVDLWVFQQNTRARAFYAAHGWRTVLLTDGAGNEEGLPDAQLRWGPDPL